MDLRSIEDRMIQEMQASATDCNDPSTTFNYVIVPDNGPKCAETLSNWIHLIFSWDDTVHIRGEIDMYDLLVDMKAFKSKGDAKKNWYKSDKEIDEGLSVFLVGKKKLPLWIWKIPQAFMAVNEEVVQD